MPLKEPNKPISLLLNKCQYNQVEKLHKTPKVKHFNVVLSHETKTNTRTNAVISL